MADGVRFVFVYRDDGMVNLMHSYRVNTFIPPHQSSPDAQIHHLVAKDANGDELLRVGLLGAFATHKTVFDADGCPKRIPAKPHGVISTIIPYHEALDHVVMTRVEHAESKVDPSLFAALLAPEVREIELGKFPAKV